MSATKLIRKTLQQQRKERSKEYKSQLVRIRKEPSVVRIPKPSNLVRAKELGYKAKQGFVVVRVKVKKGSGLHIRPNKGRRPKRMGVKKLTRAKPKKVIAEERAQRKFPNLEVLNSYLAYEDGSHKWYEVIMVDPSHPAIKKDPDISWITSPKQRGRVFRGKTK